MANLRYNRFNKNLYNRRRYRRRRYYRKEKRQQKGSGFILGTIGASLINKLLDDIF